MIFQPKIPIKQKNPPQAEGVLWHFLKSCQNNIILFECPKGRSINSSYTINQSQSSVTSSYEKIRDLISTMKKSEKQGTASHPSIVFLYKKRLYKEIRKQIPHQQRQHGFHHCYCLQRRYSLVHQRTIHNDISLRYKCCH